MGPWARPIQNYRPKQYLRLQANLSVYFSYVTSLIAIVQIKNVTTKTVDMAWRALNEREVVELAIYSQ